MSPRAVVGVAITVLAMCVMAYLAVLVSAALAVWKGVMS